MSFSSDEPIISNQIDQTINLPDVRDPKLFRDILENILRSMASTINTKEGGLYTLEETFSSELFFNVDNPQQFRNVYRKVFDFVDLNGGNISGGGSVNFAHNITGVNESAGIYAHCTAVDGRRFTVVFPDVWCDTTNAYFVNPIGVALTQCDVVLNVLKE